MKALPTRAPKFKRAGPDGELEIKFPSKREFLIRKQLDRNLRHEGSSFQVLEWLDDEWEWIDTVSPKGYAKEMVLGLGMMNKDHTKLVADYSSSMTKYIHGSITDKSGRTVSFNESVSEDAPTNSVAGGGVNLAPNALPKPKEINVTDKRHSKKKQPVLLKRFRKFITQ